MSSAAARLLALLVLGSSLQAQRPQAREAPWRSLRTAHYRIHFPAEETFRAFAEEIAAKVEGIHAQVVDGVGYESPVPIEVLIQDPMLEANGYAFPLLRHPFVTLWKTPPEADSGLADLTTWAELLVTHELVHIHHLLRPQNRPDWRDHLLDLPVGPVVRKAPRWVTEGYATLLEGKITGKGRPHSAYRAAVIRQWALQGKLPDYHRVSAFGGFRGGSMAYLLGSAYLEWLEARNPGEPAILKTFWKQLASKRRRNFDASFRATFGMAPQDGYDRWRAEVVHDALDLERRLKGKLREGEPWAMVEGEVGHLAVSPDGTKLLARVLTEKFRGLQVWDLAPKQAEPAQAGKPRKAARPDPDEPQDRPPAIPPRPATWTLRRVEGAVPRRAWWEGGRVVLEYRLAGSDGALQPRFAAWTPGRAPEPLDGAARRPPLARGWKEVDGIWNLVDPAGKPLTRTLSAAWNPAPTPDGKDLYFTLLRASGVEIRRLSLALPPLEALPLPADPVPLAPRTILPPPQEPSHLPAAVAPPPSQPYSAWTGLWNASRFGLAAGPAGNSWELGYGGSDILGRASWQVLGAAGDAAGPRGAAVGVAWRGWRWAPSLEVFSSLERPSRQRWIPVPDLDRERRGAELAVAWEDRSDWPRALRVVVAAERDVFLDGSSTTSQRRLAGLEGHAARRWRWREDWTLQLRLGAQAQAWRTDQASSTLQRGRLQAFLRPPDAFPPLGLDLELGRIGGDPASALDRFHLGGLPHSLVPAGLDAHRVESPALPAFLQVGDRLRRGRLEVGMGVKAYLEHAVVWDASAPRPASFRVAGIQFDLDPQLPEGPLQSLVGRLSVSIGLHQLLDGALPGIDLRNRRVFTASVVVRP